MAFRLKTAQTQNHTWELNNYDFTENGHICRFTRYYN